jgi:hypothetical protein
MMGELLGAVVVGFAAYLVGTILERTMPQIGRFAVVVAIGIALAVADLAGRTPQARRQVPQRLARSVRSSPVVVGGAWGFDLGLQVTTRKVASIGWFALAAAAVLRPSLAPAVSLLMALSTVLAIATWSTLIARLPRGRWLDSWRRTQRNWLRGARFLSVISTLAVLAFITVDIGAA